MQSSFLTEEVHMQRSGSATIKLAVVGMTFTLLAVIAFNPLQLLQDLYPDAYSTERQTVERLLAGKEVPYAEAAWLLRDKEEAHSVLTHIAETSDLNKDEVLALLKGRYKVRYDSSLEVVAGN